MGQDNNHSDDYPEQFTAIIGPKKKKQQDSNHCRYIFSNTCHVFDSQKFVLYLYYIQNELHPEKMNLHLVKNQLTVQ